MTLIMFIKIYLRQLCLPCIEKVGSSLLQNTIYQHKTPFCRYYFFIYSYFCTKMTTLPTPPTPTTFKVQEDAAKTFCCHPSSYKVNKYVQWGRSVTSLSDF